MAKHKHRCLLCGAGHNGVVSAQLCEVCYAHREGHIPEYVNPFDNPINPVRVWVNQDGVINQKIVKGPYRELHRGYDPATGREFMALEHYVRARNRGGNG